jgi:hypothetical protein
VLAALFAWGAAQGGLGEPAPFGPARPGSQLVGGHGGQADLISTRFGVDFGRLAAGEPNLRPLGGPAERLADADRAP